MTVAAVSVVCVFNDAAVREDCLDRSLSDAPQNVEYLPVDNSAGVFASAGAALNHGARLAKNPVVVFVHQDVYLHSLTALTHAAHQLVAADLGIGGAVGIASDGSLVGRIRDRVVLTGAAVAGATDVDSLDEVLFMVRRDLVLEEPLTESPDLAWHGYAVEYGLRMRDAGRRVAVLDIPLTHNSLTINLARLDVAHRTLSQQYRHLAPVNTTCGPIRQNLPVDRSALVRRLRGWARRALDTTAVLAASRGVPRGVSLVDLRRVIDEIVASSPHATTVINTLHGTDFVDGGAPLLLVRRGRRVGFRSESVHTACDLAQGPADVGRILITDLTAADFRAARRRVGTTVRSGYHEATGFWILSGTK